MPKPGTGVPDIDEFLDGPRQHGPCIYIRSTTPEQRAVIKAKVDGKVRKWTAFQRWLEAQGSMVESVNIAFHFNRSHLDDK